MLNFFDYALSFSFLRKKIGKTLSMTNLPDFTVCNCLGMVHNSWQKRLDI